MSLLWGREKDDVFILVHFALANGTCTFMYKREMRYLV